MLFIFFILSLNVSAADYAGAHVSTLRNWVDVAGPSNDRNCKNVCDTAQMVQTVTCQGKEGGIIGLHDAWEMFCSPFHTISMDDHELPTKNAINLYNCFRTSSQKDKQAQYDVFIHEMACNWLACYHGAKGHFRVDSNKGTWKMHPDESIDLILKGSRTIHVDNSRDFGKELMVNNLSLCDLYEEIDPATANTRRVPQKLPGSR